MQQSSLPTSLLLVGYLGSLVITLIVLLGPAFLRVFRNISGPLKYWGAGVVLTALLLWAGISGLAYLFGSLWMTIGIYSEFEEKGRAGFYSGMISVLAGSALMMISPDYKQIRSNLDLLPQVMNSSGLVLNAEQKEAVLAMMPTFVAFLMITFLAMGLMMDRRMARLLGKKYEPVAGRIRLLEFRLPDFMIWVTMLSFLFSFWKIEGSEGLQVIATNILWVSAGLYMLQGLAVAEVAMLVWKVGPILKLLIYLLVIGQLFVLLCPVGLIDYWVDFRRRLRNSLSRRNQRNGENL